MCTSEAHDTLAGDSPQNLILFLYTGSPVSPGLSSVLQLLTGGSFASFWLTCFCRSLRSWGRRTGNYLKCNRWSHHPLKTIVPSLCKRDAPVTAVTVTTPGLLGSRGVRKQRKCNQMGFSLTSFPGGSDSKESTCSAGDWGSLPGSGRSPGEENGYPLQYSCPDNPMDRGTWRATVHGSWRVKHDWATNTYHFPCVLGDPHRAPQTRAGGLPWSFVLVHDDATSKSAAALSQDQR